MVSLRDLTDDYYTFDEENYCLRGERTGRIFTLGDGVRIRVMRPTWHANSSISR